MNLKRLTATFLAVIVTLATCLTAYADVNLDNIIHGADGAVGRYSYSGQQWGWIVEVYVATTESGKLNESRTLTDPSNAAYLGRVAFLENPTPGRLPALQRPVAIQLNGGGSLPQLTNDIKIQNGAASLGFPDPVVTTAPNMKALFEVGQPALQNTWLALESISGGPAGLLQKVINNLSQPIKDKTQSMGNPDVLNPNNPNCPVGYAFVLTPLEYILINPNSYSSIGWNEQFWMGANEGAVLNRASIIMAQQNLQTFLDKTAGTAIVGTAAYNEALAILQLACTRGELYWFQNLSHRALPDSAYLDHNQFGITTPNKNA